MLLSKQERDELVDELAATFEGGEHSTRVAMLYAVNRTVDAVEAALSRRLIGMLAAPEEQ